MAKGERLTEEQQGTLIANIVHGKINRQDAVLLMTVLSSAYSRGLITDWFGPFGEEFVKRICKEKS